VSETTEYIKSLRVFELAFLKEYKLKTYFKPTQELIFKEIFNRGLQDYELRNMIRDIEFNPDNTGCPRCDSQKIRTDEIKTSRNARGGGFNAVYVAAAAGSGKDLQSKGKLIVCEICGYVLQDDDAQESFFEKVVRNFRGVFKSKNKE
jgi:hypothetical protein